MKNAETIKFSILHSNFYIPKNVISILVGYDQDYKFLQATITVK